ncbi:MAG: glycosyltransferase [Candidatus Zixiibacteriota bacterium]
MTDSCFKILVMADSRAFHTERYVAELARQGCDVFLASLERGEMPHYQLKARGPISKLHYLLGGTEVREVIAKYKPDVINPHYASGYGFMAALAGARKHAPVVMHLWGSDILIVPDKSIFHRRKVFYALAQADCVLADSQYLMDAAEQVTTVKKKAIIPWGMEKEFLKFHRTDYKLSHPLKIIVPRRHEKIYNNLFLVRALAPLINEGKIEVTFPDFGNLVGHFLVHARNLVGDKIKVYPKMSRADYLSFISGFDVYLSSALSDSSPASMLEAMGLGLIPIAADIPGVREWLSEASGFLYELHHAQQLNDIVTGLINRDDPHELMRRGNLRKVTEQALFEDNVAKTIEIMRHLAAGTES